jgi:hypothetical protein
MSFSQEPEDERQHKYGNVPGMNNDELADPVELERLSAWQMWGPVLALRPQWSKARIAYCNDGSGAIDWGAVGTITCHRVESDRPDAARANRQILELVRPNGVIRAPVNRRTEAPRFPERPEDYPEYDDLVRWGIIQARADLP